MVRNSECSEGSRCRRATEQQRPGRDWLHERDTQVSRQFRQVPGLRESAGDVRRHQLVPRRQPARRFHTAFFSFFVVLIVADENNDDSPSLLRYFTPKTHSFYKSSPTKTVATTEWPSQTLEFS